MQGDSNKSITDQMLAVLQIAIIALAVLLIFLPGLRAGLARETFKVLYMSECVALFYRVMRSGRTRQSPESSVEGLMTGRIAPITTALERGAFLIAVLALIVMAMS